MTTKTLLTALLLAVMLVAVAVPVYAQAGTCKPGAHFAHGTCVASGSRIGNRLCPKYPFGALLPPHNPLCR